MDADEDNACPLCAKETHHDLGECPQKDNVGVVRMGLQKLVRRWQEGDNAHYIALLMGRLRMRLQYLEGEAEVDEQKKGAAIDLGLVDAHKTLAGIKQPAPQSAQPTADLLNKVDAQMLERFQQLLRDHLSRSSDMPVPSSSSLLSTGRQEGRSEAAPRHLRILDHLPDGLQFLDDENDHEVLELGQFGLRVHRPEKQRLQRVTQMQWVYANEQIREKLVASGVATAQEYSEYTKHIILLSFRYRWKDLVLYDDVFRKRQAEKGFAWTDPQVNLQMVYLGPWAVQQQYMGHFFAPGESESGDSRGTRNKTGSVCYAYSNGSCTTGSCQHRHVCALCFQKHPVSACSKLSAKGQQRQEECVCTIDTPATTFYRLDFFVNSKKSQVLECDTSGYGWALTIAASGWLTVCAPLDHHSDACRLSTGAITGLIALERFIHLSSHYNASASNRAGFTLFHKSVATIKPPRYLSRRR
ncbi:hypothetical protein THASP1DRAFT_25778 [Thamnocephalis sphaerospora]|uniref:C3H1-type domain-containing protein n=1 Tax=Thamnocephalis sphaerospora TaxID=78915 RepID=A0A4P9XJ85_9FUNG|nr:hypothetical protein THASP1DRAFT_25778 [Thamnocephalis sphaerospora]|eukprot:RKP05786.1 hypothetical protein THASP1DRAFT_25778 [Thamnocephalis sphaerospora]